MKNADTENLRTDTKSSIQSPDSELLDTVAPSSVQPHSESLDGAKSSMIGPYRLLRQIGVGGMGSVFEAEQTAPVRRRVAIKLVKAGIESPDLVARFKAERQALSMMDHPNIAKVLDLGTTEDHQPYFVMELVDGTSITHFCDQNQLGLRERLETFVQTCRAIQHAHLKGIIHRDIKPNNVLVCVQDGKPTVKVIDFGLAKATHENLRLTDQSMYTQYGQVLGTVQYMSPEQAGRNPTDVDTRSDVYSLGVLLYELLSGTTPIEGRMIRERSLGEVLTAIRQQEPPRPSTRLNSTLNNRNNATTPEICSSAMIQDLNIAQRRKLCRLLQGELDWIAIKAIEIDRNRRYDSVGALADDVQRYLNGDAIEARPPSLTYRARKMVAKHRSTSLVVAAFVAMLLAATGFSSYFAYQARMSLVRANESAELAKEAAELANEAAIREQIAKEIAVAEAENARLAMAEVTIQKAEVESLLDQDRERNVELLAKQERIKELTVQLTQQIVASVPSAKSQLENAFSRKMPMFKDAKAKMLTFSVFDPDADRTRDVEVIFDSLLAGSTVGSKGVVRPSVPAPSVPAPSVLAPSVPGPSIKSPAAPIASIESILKEMEAIDLEWSKQLDGSTKALSSPPNMIGD